VEEALYDSPVMRQFVAIPLVVSFLCTAQNRSSSPESFVVCLSISSGGNLLYIPVERETLFRVSLAIKGAEAIPMKELLEKYISLPLPRHDGATLPPLVICYLPCPSPTSLEAERHGTIYISCGAHRKMGRWRCGQCKREGLLPSALKTVRWP
jgi:hypothetical protein